MPRKKKKSNMYFTQLHEDAIVKYSNSTDKKERKYLYEEIIGPALSSMVEKVVYTFKFNNLPNIDNLKKDCKNWLPTILDKYDPEHQKGKAFGYFSVITKNWFIAEFKKRKRKLEREVSIDNYCREDKVNPEFIYFNDPLEIQERIEFITKFREYAQTWEDRICANEEDKRIVRAFLLLFDHAEDLPIINKKAVYLYIREVTGIPGPKVTNMMSFIKMEYSHFVKKWQNEIF